MPFVPGSIASKFIGSGTNTSGGFVPGSVANKYLTSPISSGGFVAGSIASKYPSAKKDLTSIEGLRSYAQSVGLGREADEILNTKPKLSALQRIGSILGSFNTAEAVLTGKEKGVGQGILKYISGIGKGIASGITGTDYQGGRRTYSDVAEKLGVENGIAKFGLGFVGDVLLDPTTYFGGAMVEGLAKGAGLGTQLALKGASKIAPEATTDFVKGANLIKDAFGGLFKVGYGASKGALEDTLTFLNKVDKAKLGLAESNLNRLGVGVLTKDQLEELSLKLFGGKRAEYLAREGGKSAEEAAQIARQAANSSDELVQSTIESQSARTKKFAGQLGLDTPYETYFPFLKKDKIDKFLTETTVRNIKVGSEQYLKKFRNLLTDDVIEKNPAKAFFTSEAQQVTNRMTRGFMEGFVDQYGVPLSTFKNDEEALTAGYRLLKEKGLYGKELGYVPKGDANLLKNLVNPEFQSLNMVAKATGFDAMTNLFKRSVTGLFLPFHVRNYASGIIQNFEALGVESLLPQNLATGQKFAYLLAKGEAPESQALKKIFQPFADRFGSDTFYKNDFIRAIDEGSNLRSAEGVFSKSAARSTLGFQDGNLLPLVGNDGIPFRLGRTVGQFIEHQQKATAYVTALGKGSTVKEALKLAETAGFDYRAMTAFESQIMKRLIPFYGFTRKNIELQLKTLGEHPERINQVLSFFQNIGDRISPDEKKSLPEYIQDSIGIKLEDLPNGVKQYISSFGTPIENFADIINKNYVLKLISMTNPLLKVPIEIGVGVDSFREKDLKDVYDATEYKGMPKLLKEILSIREVQKDVLEKQSNGKLKKIGERTQYIADPERLLIARSLFTSRGITYFDQIFGGDLKGFAKLLKTTTGIKPQQVDLELQQDIKDTQNKRALEDLLKREGGLASFSRTFIPK